MWEPPLPGTYTTEWRPVIEYKSILVAGCQGDLPWVCKWSGILGHSSLRGCGFCTILGKKVPGVGLKFPECAASLSNAEPYSLRALARFCLPPRRCARVLITPLPLPCRKAQAELNHRKEGAGDFAATDWLPQEYLVRCAVPHRPLGCIARSSAEARS